MHPASILVHSLAFRTLFSSSAFAAATPWTEIIVKDVRLLGPQFSPAVTNISRDGGQSVLVDGSIVWLYDDTECFGYEGDQLSFVSNSAATADPNTNISSVHDYGVREVGNDSRGRRQYAILANRTVGTGGWIPFEQEELDFNDENGGEERLAIWPGTPPTPINLAESFLFAPMVYINMTPKVPGGIYRGRGMALVTINVTGSAPTAARRGGLIVPGNEIEWGGFASVLGGDGHVAAGSDGRGRDVYLIGVADNGLQLARVPLSRIASYPDFSFFHPRRSGFSLNPPAANATDPTDIYLPGSFSSGNVFYSPYFQTFAVVYFNHLADSTFYIRFLDLNAPLVPADSTWVEGGKSGNGISADDAEALAKYAWSEQQTLYVSPQAKGYNYAGNAHPEYFNARYFAPSAYPEDTSPRDRRNDWYGANVLEESDAGGDGRHLLLSWTSQQAWGYQIWLAKVEFGDLPLKGIAGASATSSQAAPTSAASPSAPSLTSAANRLLPQKVLHGLFGGRRKAVGRSCPGGVAPCTEDAPNATWILLPASNYPRIDPVLPPGRGPDATGTFPPDQTYYPAATLMVPALVGFLLIGCLFACLYLCCFRTCWRLCGRASERLTRGTYERMRYNWDGRDFEQPDIQVLDVWRSRV